MTHATIRGRNAGRRSSTRPICANAKASAARFGGSRLERWPGTPTALAEYPQYRTSSAYPAIPATSSGGPHERRSPSRDTATPSCHGAHQTATTFTGPISTTASATGSSTAATPRWRSRNRHTGVSADSTT
ncbi:MAG: hypothetical protein ABWY11_03095 [Umezawaea sp.]